jgi:hypothetical protein
VDAKDFDALLRAWSVTPSRRAALRLLTGGVLSAGLTLPAALTQAKKKKRKKHRRPAAVSPPPVPPPPPVCKKVEETCNANCCTGLTCGDNFCGEDPRPSVCCGSTDASCAHACDCCGSTSYCQGGTCQQCTDGINCLTDCCQSGSEVCVQPSSSPSFCQGGGCPATANFCADSSIYFCDNGCVCATSMSGKHVCSDLDFDTCQSCTADTQCGTGKVCLQQNNFRCSICSGMTGFCVNESCPSSAGMTAAEGTHASSIFATRSLIGRKERRH